MLVGEIGRQALHQVEPAALAQPQGLSNYRHDHRRVPDLSQSNQEHPVGEAIERVRRGLKSEAGLAGAAWASQGNKTL